MADPRFFSRQSAIALFRLAEISGATLEGGNPDLPIEDVAALDAAGPSQVSFLDNPKYLEAFGKTKAAACFVRPRYQDRAPAGLALLLSDDPYRAYAMAAQYFYPASRPQASVAPGAQVAASARIGEGVSIGQGAVIGERVEIGNHAVIGANAVIEDGVVIGEGTHIGALCSISHALIGRGVIIHRGVHIGQDGFGFAMGPKGHEKVPQLGRVIIGDGVEIGAGTCIDRGAGPDTEIGAGTKIDNLVQIGHNVKIGRGCVVVSQVGISGSTVLGDGVVVGGQAGIAGHLAIGSGAMLAARTGVTANLEGGKTYGGTPAVPIKDWHRQTVALNRLIRPTRQEES